MKCDEIQGYKEIDGSDDTIEKSVELTSIICEFGGRKEGCPDML